MIAIEFVVTTIQDKAIALKKHRIAITPSTPLKPSIQPDRSDYPQS